MFKVSFTSSSPHHFKIKNLKDPFFSDNNNSLRARICIPMKIFLVDPDSHKIIVDPNHKYMVQSCFRAS
jgi:hypothetical protein